MTKSTAGVRTSKKGAGVIWITGLSGSGKTTLSRGLCRRLEVAGHANVSLLDGEEVRDRLPRRYGHSLEERAAVARHVIRLADDDLAAGRTVIYAGISHQRWMRDLARAKLGRVFEVYLDCPAEICAERDVKGHYARAYRGEEACFIGVTHAYETSARPDLVLDTARTSIEACLSRLTPAVLSFLDES